MQRLVVLDAVGPAFVQMLTRAWAEGDAVLPLDPRLPAPARAAVLAAARPDEPVEAGDALVVATSGTSGEPKLAVLTHGAVAASARATSERLEVDPTRDRWLACLPLAHVGGLSVVTRALLTGTPCTVHDRFDAARSTTPLLTVARSPHWCRQPWLASTPPATGPSSSEGRPLPADRPPHAIVTYGMTETGSGVVYDGVPLDGVELRIDDGDQIQLRGPMLLRAYRDGTDPKDADGWFPTGDLGALDGSRLQVHGRRGDLIITGGENVWPAVVERALLTHPGVAEVAVVGRPDPEWGQRVVAVVVPTDPAAPPTLDSLRHHAKQTLPSHAAPKELLVVTALPRTTSGKVRRTDLTAG